MTPFRIVCLVLLCLALLFVVVLSMDGTSGGEVSPPGWTYWVRDAFSSLSPSIQLQAAPLDLSPGAGWEKIVPPGKSPVRILKLCLESNSRVEAVYAATLRGRGDEQLMEMMSQDDGCEDGECRMELPRGKSQGPYDDPHCGSFIVVTGGGQLSLECVGSNPCRIRFQ